MGKLTKAFEKSLESAEEKDSAISNLFSDNNWDQRLQLSTDPHSQFFEQFRNLRASLLYPSSGRQPKTVLVTSVLPGEGKGFVCANLGIALSQAMEHHALMVDCDLRRPTLATLFGLANESGLVDHLQDHVDLSLLIRKTGQPKLSILPSGKPPKNPSELLTSARMIKLINELSGHYQDRIILFDSPPNIVASETGILAQHLDGVIIVVRHGIAKKEDVKNLVDELGQENILGLVYNGYPETKIKAFIDKKMGYGYNQYYY